MNVQTPTHLSKLTSSFQATNPVTETKLCIIIDSKTPIIMKAPCPPNAITLGYFKSIASLHDKRYKFYFRSHDSEFGVVKEEVIEDDSILPTDGDRIVAWIITEDSNQTTLFETCSQEVERTYENLLPSPPHIPSLTTSPVPPVCNSSPRELTRSFYIQVQLHLNNYNFLGLTLVGPIDESDPNDKGIYVGDIVKNSVVEQDGRIQIGDKVVEINGLNLTDMKCDDAIATFRACINRRGVINLVFLRKLSPQQYNQRKLTPQLNHVVTPNQYNAAPRMFEPSIENLPIPDFEQSESREIRDTYSLPRSVTPRSLYTTNHYDNVNIKIDSRSVYEQSSPISARQFDQALHCARDSIHTIYAAIVNDPISLDIKDREWLKFTVKNAFLGSALVKWLRRNVYGFSHRREVKRFANKMLELGLIKSPMSVGTFSEKCYYTLS